MRILKNRKARHIARKINIPRAPFRIVRRAESFNIRVQFAAHFVQNFAHDGRINPANQRTVRRHEIHQPRKFKFDVAQIIINIRVVEFDIIDDRNFGADSA